MQIRFPESHLLAFLLPKEPAVSCGKNLECYWLSEKRGLEMPNKQGPKAAEFHCVPPGMWEEPRGEAVGLQTEMQKQNCGLGTK